MSSIAIITGGASGIGRALGEELAKDGVEIAIADRQIELAEEVADGIRSAGGKATAHTLDVRSFDAFDALAKETAKRGRIEYLFNNAGIAIGGEIAHYSVQDWNDVIDVNLRGVANGIQAVYPIMIEQHSGHIVNTASMAGLVAAPEGSYSATKHAVVGLSKALRIEGKSRGVRVSVLCPGAIRTPILTGGKFGRINIPGATEEKIMRAWERVYPMDPKAFARQTLEGVRKNEPIIVVPKWWKALWYLERVSPSLSLRLWTRVARQLERDLSA